MDTFTLPSQSNSYGEVFTPIPWAKWLLSKFNVIDEWLKGKRVADPTAGSGNFIISLVELAGEKGNKVTDADLKRLFLFDRNHGFLEEFKSTFLRKFGRRFPEENVVSVDIILNTPSTHFDILVGNPPWVNFADLDESYKTLLKPHFVASGLITDNRRLLLGGSRVDLSALILQKCLGTLLADAGSAIFFVPLSLFFGDDAHSGFRSYSAYGRNFSVEGIWDLKSEVVFEGISTSYGVAQFAGDKKQVFPIPYFNGSRESRPSLQANYLRFPSDPLRVTDPSDSVSHTEFSFSLTVAHEQSPRQGINTCGANDLFLFDTPPPFIPEHFIFPLVTKENFRSLKSVPMRWIFLPYFSSTGKIAEQSDLERYPDLWSYLNKNRSRLESRKGTMLAATIRRGYWWTLLGVGPYCFAPFKVIWEAYGSRDFRPRILGSFERREWQANQAMQAFIPCWTEDDAIRISGALGAPEFQQVLTQLNGGGKCNWAQPGKIRKLINFHAKQEQMLDNLELPLVALPRQ